MALSWPLSIGPSFPVSDEVQPRVLVSEFGDGFEARSGDGINILRNKWALQWNGLTVAEKNTAIAFLEARYGVENFLFTPPGGSATKVTCRGWRVNQTDVDSFALTTEFVQDFNP